MSVFQNKDNYRRQTAYDTWCLETGHTNPGTLLQAHLHSTTNDRHQTVAYRFLRELYSENHCEMRQRSTRTTLTSFLRQKRLGDNQ